MSRISLRAIIAEELADIGQDVRYKLPACKARSTVWLGERGLGVRRYASGRAVYIVQIRMGGRCRTVTIAPTSVVTARQSPTGWVAPMRWLPA